MFTKYWKINLLCVKLSFKMYSWIKRSSCNMVHFIFLFLSPNCITRAVVDGYVGFSHYSYLYLHTFPIDTLRNFYISLCLVRNIIISGLNNIVKGRPLPWYYPFFLLYFCNIVQWWPKLSAEIFCLYKK
jgi:hypothetical protein